MGEVIQKVEDNRIDFWKSKLFALHYKLNISRKNGQNANYYVIYKIFRTIYRVGTAGVLGGATLTGVGLLTNNNGLTNAGLNLGAAGVGSKLLAHVFGKK